MLACRRCHGNASDYCEANGMLAISVKSQRLKAETQPRRPSSNMKGLLVFVVVSSAILLAEVQSNPVEVVSYDQGAQTFRLDAASVDAIFQGPQCKDKPISLISIAGATRKGKSFLLNFFIKYLNAQGAANWLGNPNDPLTGFSWRGGSERETTGIVLWSQPFVVQSRGQAVCVVLMDTQGAFDGQQAVAETAAIFALSAMTSSVQIFNVAHNLQENDLQNLEMFTEYGRLVLDKTKATPFQKILFLIRDWPFAEEYAYGLEGGRRFLETKLAVQPGQAPEIGRVRQNLKTCYTHTDCFLMAHPGLKASTSKAFDGRLSDIDPEFVNELQALAPSLLHGDNLMLKTIAGQQVNGAQLADYFKEYVKVFIGNTLPKPTSLFEATAHVSNRAALARAVQEYLNHAAASFGDHVGYIDWGIFAARQNELVAHSLAVFNSISKVGDAPIVQSYQAELQRQIGAHFAFYQNKNSLKGQILEQRRLEEQRRIEAEAAAQRQRELELKMAQDRQNEHAMNLGLHHVNVHMDASFANAGPVEPHVVNDRYNQLINEANGIFNGACAPNGEHHNYWARLVAHANGQLAHFTNVNNHRIALRNEQARQEQLRQEEARQAQEVERQRQELARLEAERQAAEARRRKKKGGGLGRRIKKIFG